MKVLFVDCCIREESRTKRLCEEFLKEVLSTHPDYELERVVLKDQNIQPYREKEVIKRDELIRAGKFTHPMLRYAIQFVEADRILIGAPYWDLCFPSLLKVYIEHIFANGITFAYEGPKAVGKCHAEKMMYIQTAGGLIEKDEVGTLYLKVVCDMLGIKQFDKICADGIDIQEIPKEPRIQMAFGQIKEKAPLW